MAGIGKAIIGLLPFALLHDGRVIIPRKALLLAAWVLGIGMSIYGGLGLVSDVLHISGVIANAENQQWFLVFLVVWDPWWVLGGFFYVATAWLVQHSFGHSSG